MTSPDAEPAANRWAAAWPDGVAFVAGLGLAWWQGWATKDLVWSLWLSSLVVGYAMIVFGAFSPAALHFREGRTGAGIFQSVSGLATAAFFTVHFGIFHWAQAAILNTFLPLDGSGDFPGLQLLGVAVRDYGWFVPVAAVAERAGFRLRAVPPEPPRTSVKAKDIAARKARQGYGMDAVMKPYLNVIRMHVLMIGFGVAHATDFENFGVYAVVYAVYFFPWRLVMRPDGVPGGKAA